MFFYHFISSETDEVRAKREPSLCNESVKRYFFPTQLQLRPKLVTTLRELLLHVRFFPFFSYIAAIETQIGDNTKELLLHPFLPFLFLHSCNCSYVRNEREETGEVGVL